MTTVALSLHRIDARFDAPHGDARSVWHGREGIAVKARLGSDVGLGEASPLPGRSAESHAEALAALRALGETIEVPEPALGRVLELPALPASARFGLETALLDLFSRRAGVPLAHWLLRVLHDTPGQEVRELPARIETQLLLDRLGDPSALEQTAEARVVNVKIARPGRAGEEIAMLRAIRALRPDVIIRADADGVSISPDLLDGLVEVGCEMLEDPGPFDLLDDSFAIPTAIDEHLARDPRAVLGAIDAWVVTGGVVLKPTLLGGLTRALTLGGYAHRAGVHAIASHAFESPIGMAAAGHLALALGAWTSHGLGRWSGLERFEIEGEPIPVPAWIGRCHVERPALPGLGLT